MIKVANKRTFNRSEVSGDVAIVYVGRPSPLGNPFYMKDESKRDAVCDAYDEWLRIRAADVNSAQYKELMRLMSIYHGLSPNHDTLVLTCWCAPKRCHAESIRALLREWCGI